MKFTNGGMAKMHRKNQIPKITPSAIVVMLAFYLIPAVSFGSTSVSLSPVARQQFNLETTGLPNANGKLCTYQAGTTTPLATYTDGTGSVTNSNPINLDISGMPINGSSPVGIWLANGVAYKFILYDST